MKEKQALVAKLRGYRRLPEIASVLVRHGFRDVVVGTGLARLSGAEDGEVVGAETDGRPARVRRAIEELGPTFIKLGQMLSVRPDLVPEEFVDELRKLQDEVPPVPFEAIEKRIEEELGDRVGQLFESISSAPLAAASIAQVHEAKLRTGESVVIKVLRPEIRRTMEADMELLATLAEFAEERLANPGFSPQRVVRELSSQLERELDLTLEGKSTDRFRRFFADDPELVFAKIHWPASTSGMLTMEQVRGATLARIDIDALKPSERRRLCENGARAVFRQCLELGFFHADPHPGNLMMTSDGRLAFIDCGMTGHLDNRTRSQLADLIASLASDQIDLDRVVRVSLALGGGDPKLAEDRDFRADAWELVSRLEDLSLDTLEMGALLQDLFALLRRHGVQCPSDLVFLVKAIATIEGVAQEIDPGFDLVGYVRPQIEGLLAERYGVPALKRRLERSLVRYSEMIERLPEDLSMLLDRLRTDTFSVRLEHKRLEALNAELEHASRNIAYAFIIAALLVSSSILILADRLAQVGGAFTTIGAIGLLGSAVLIVLLVLANLRRSNKELE